MGLMLVFCALLAMSIVGPSVDDATLSESFVTRNSWEFESETSNWEEKETTFIPEFGDDRDMPFTLDRAQVGIPEEQSGEYEEAGDFVSLEMKEFQTFQENTGNINLDTSTPDNTVQLDYAAESDNISGIDETSNDVSEVCVTFESILTLRRTRKKDLGSQIFKCRMRTSCKISLQNILNQLHPLHLCLLTSHQARH